MADRGTQSDTHIDQMRELMVGPLMREYQSRLDQLESTLTATQDANQKRFDEVMDGLLRELNKAVSAADKKVRGLDLKAGEERSELQAQFEQLEEQVTARLDTLEADLSSFQEETRKRLDSIHESLTNALNKAIEASDKRVQTITSRATDRGADLRKRAKRTEEKLEARYQSLTDEIESSSAALRADLTESNKGLQDELQRLRVQLTDEISQRFIEVRDSKVSKDEISEILFEFGMRIKGMEFVNDVPQLAAPVTPSSRSDGKQ